MTFKDKLKPIIGKLRMPQLRIKNLSWENVILIAISCSLTLFVFHQIRTNPLIKLDSRATLTNLLTINGIFSAILITYLFTRITWSKDRKLELYNEAISLSQKITEFRRILYKLTLYYNVWNEDKYAKKLIDHGKFKHIDFYDYRLKMTSDYEPKDSLLIDEYCNHENFSEGISTLYLAMVSLVKNRKSEFLIQEELYSDFEHKGIYDFNVVLRWLECGIMGTMWYWLNQNRNWIYYDALGENDIEYILAAASRINSKYKGKELNNKLLEELAGDMDAHYLKELYSRLRSLKKGIQDLNLLIIILITFSLFFGILLPFLLFLLSSIEFWYSTFVALIASINIGLISYFVLKFPFLINRELKWV